MSTVNGSWDPIFNGVAERLGASVEAGEDVGASVAITLDGQMVVDIWSGWADASRTVPWQADTLTNVWSSTKTVTALAALTLADRGVIDLFQPVAAYWPAFAAQGKETVEVRHLLSHTSGVCGWEQPVQLSDLYDTEASAALLAAQAPWWEPGTRSGYHDRSYGHLIGEVIRRTTGKTLGAFVASELAGPLGADFHIGLEPAQAHRVANVIPFDGPLPIDSAIPGSVKHRTLSAPSWTPQISWTPAWRQAEIGAANGHGHARSLARILSVLACGGEVEGQRWLSPESCDRVVQEQANGIDLVLEVPVRWGLGYALRNETLHYFPKGRVCGWGGWGGSIVLADLDRRLSISYVMNRMVNGVDERGPNLVRAAYAALGVA
ncbi:MULTISPECIES: serine hydrolase domain-containing protein [Aphanothece]|uniref:serine hydrolase domain-containing protein n=1 Tax=Aphanothece TaxID=1121 RepID=UPI00398515AC